MPPGDGDDGDGEEEHQQPQLLVRLLQRGQQRLEAREVAHQLGRETIAGVNEILAKFFTIFGESAHYIVPSAYTVTHTLKNLLRHSLPGICMLVCKEIN